MLFPVATEPAAARRGDRPAGPACPRVGTWVRVTSGPAAGARGCVCCCRGGRLTLVATLLPRRPLLLTIDAADCTPLS